MSDKIEEINNTPSLKEIRVKRQEIVTTIFHDRVPEELKNSPCVCCENADWRLTNGGVISAYCKNRFDIIYSTKNFATDSDTVIKCADFEMALATE